MINKNKNLHTYASVPISTAWGWYLPALIADCKCFYNFDENPKSESEYCL